MLFETPLHIVFDGEQKRDPPLSTYWYRDPGVRCYCS